MVLFTAIRIFWNKSASHDLLKIVVTASHMLPALPHGGEKPDLPS